MIVPVALQMGYMVKNFAPDADSTVDFFDGFLGIGKGEFWYTLAVVSEEKIGEGGLKKPCLKGRLPDDRASFKIELEKKEGSILHLTDQEWVIFFSILTRVHSDFVVMHSASVEKLRRENYNVMRESCKKLGDICPVIQPATIVLDFPTAELEILNSPKFDCNLG